KINDALVIFLSRIVQSTEYGVQSAEYGEARTVGKNGAVDNDDRGSVGPGSPVSPAGLFPGSGATLSCHSPRRSPSCGGSTGYERPPFSAKPVRRGERGLPGGGASASGFRTGVHQPRTGVAPAGQAGG